jgi:hypothetical protein
MLPNTVCFSCCSAFRCWRFPAVVYRLQPARRESLPLFHALLMPGLALPSRAAPRSLPCSSLAQPCLAWPGRVPRKVNRLRGIRIYSEEEVVPQPGIPDRTRPLPRRKGKREARRLIADGESVLMSIECVSCRRRVWGLFGYKHQQRLFAPLDRCLVACEEQIHPSVKPFR